MRRRIAVDDVIALLDEIAILQMDVLALRDEIFHRLDGLVRRFDRDAALVLVIAAEPDGAGLFRDDRRILRLACFEQFRNTRQTAGDVAGLGAFGRDTRNRVAGLHLRTDVDGENCVNCQHVAGIAAARDLERFAVLAVDDDRRTKVRTAA